LLIFHAETGNCQDQSQWQCQQTQSGQVYTPNIPDFYFNHTNAADFWTGNEANLTTRRGERGTAFIFSIPPKSSNRNCSGNVTALEYCYQTRRGLNESFSIFALLSLSKNGSQFTINNRFVIRTTTGGNVCTNIPTNDPEVVERICCDRNFEPSFQLMSSAHWFGVVPLRNNNNRPLAFNNSINEYRVEQYQVGHVNRPGPVVNETFSSVNDLRTDQSFILLRFYIGEYYFHICIQGWVQETYITLIGSMDTCCLCSMVMCVCVCVYVGGGLRI
jgi:hypothetical protein